MTSFDFDTVHDRKHTGSKKWALYGDDILPMWIADMDFAAPPPVIDAMKKRMDHPFFGYCLPQDEVRSRIVADMDEKYGWQIAADDIIFLPGVEAGFNMALNSELEAGEGLLIQTPIYNPILTAHKHWGLTSVEAPLMPSQAGYVIDEQALESGFARSKAFLFCNPHNPTGKVFTATELALIADACIRHDLLLISDEIHCELVFDGRKHIPIASLSPEIARRTVTLMSASKTYNIAGLKTSFAVIQDPALRQRVNAARSGLVDSVNVFGLQATLAAYESADEWRRQLIAYLEGNRDYLQAEIARRFPKIRMIAAESTYLAWLDCSALDLADAPQRFFLDKGKVAFSAGSDFGADYGQYLRINFGCPRSLITEGLERMEAALKS
ncbi:PatB family C-S lyase [Rhizobium sp. 18065]|uniref:MalY/PatB family protein n=1 Tax=Rhizobium sp. 18065 TaxID=2681411 RepID=UPI00135B3545|nr:PatB family C-S lyase [Rhizobium sp. 18065]